jgi:hypothetical protein
MTFGTRIFLLKHSKNMKKMENMEYSLYGIVYPGDMHKLRASLDKLAEAINEVYSQSNPKQLVRVEFDFKLISKGDVYKFLVKATTQPNGLKCSQRKLAVILATFTNLADNPVCSKRVNTILRSYKRYKKLLK